MGKVVNVGPGDFVRIECSTKAKTIAASVLFDLHEALGQVAEKRRTLVVAPNAANKWFAVCGRNFQGESASPLHAIAGMEEV